MTWLEALPTILLACAVIAGPGLLITAPLRLGVLGRAAIAGPVGVCAAGIATIVFGALGMPLSLWQILLVSLIGLGICLALRRAVRRTERHDTGHGWWIAASWVVSATAFAITTFHRVPTPERISQTYDSVFHLSAVATILDGFSASSLTLRSLIETEGGGIAYYPSAWHVFAAVTAQTAGVSVPVAFNAVWIAVVAVIWLPGIAWLTQILIPARVAALIAFPLGVSFGWFPYALLTWGTVYPTAIAHALLPAAVGLGILAVRAVVPLGRAGGALRRWGLAALAVILVGGALGFAQPRVLPTLVVILVPYLGWRLVAAYREARAAGGLVAVRARRMLWGGGAGVVLVAAAGIAVAVFGLGLFDEPLSERLNGPQARATQSIEDGVWQLIALSSRTGVRGIITAALPLAAAAVIIGVIVALRRRELRWMVISYALVGVLYILAAGSDDDLTKLLTGIWYKDGYRLAAALPVLAVPLATLGILTVSRWIAARRSGRERAVIAGAIGAGVALSSTIGLAVSGTGEATAVVFHEPAQAAQREVVSTKQIAFMRDVVPTIVPDDQRLLGDPWDGSALTALYARREPVFPHVNGQWDRNRRVLAWNLELIDTDPEVCEALDALRVRYVLYNPHAFGGGDPAGNHFPGPHDAVDAGVFEPVATDGESILYRIDQCGPLD